MQEKNVCGAKFFFNLAASSLLSSRLRSSLENRLASFLTACLPVLHARLLPGFAVAFHPFPKEHSNEVALPWCFPGTLSGSGTCVHRSSSAAPSSSSPDHH